jgi:RNA polymerase sigma factor (sigma-70 family)
MARSAALRRKPGPGSALGTPAIRPVTASASDRDEVLLPLMVAMCEGCQASFRRLLGLTRGRLHGIALRILDNHADVQDVLQEVHLRIWQRCHDFDTARGQVFGWLAAMARHAAIDGLRRRGARPQTGLRTPLQDEDPYLGLHASEPQPCEWLHRSQCTRAVQTCLRGLPPNQRQVMTLAFGEGLSQSEIALRLQRPLGTVKSWFSRSFAVLRPLLADQVSGAEAGGAQARASVTGAGSSRPSGRPTARP